MYVLVFMRGLAQLCSCPTSGSLSTFPYIYPCGAATIVPFSRSISRNYRASSSSSSVRFPSCIRRHASTLCSPPSMYNVAPPRRCVVNTIYLFYCPPFFTPFLVDTLHHGTTLGAVCGTGCPKLDQRGVSDQRQSPGSRAF